MYYVYAYFLPDSNLPFYIGKGKGIRVIEHYYPYHLNQNNPFHKYLRVLQEKGINPRIEKLWENLTEEEAFAYEKDAIQFYGRKCNGTGCLLNVTGGGEGGSGHVKTLEQRVALSKRAMRRAKEPGYTDWIKQTGFAETPRRIARKRHGRIDREFDSLQEAASVMSVSSQSICDALKGRSNTCGGYTWVYLE